MGKRILYCASTASHILNFHLSYLEHFKELGWQVDVAVAGEGKIPFADRIINLPMRKTLLALDNLRSVFTMREVIKKNHYDIISTHTTLAGAVVRLALLLTGKKYYGKVVHTSHGYFFSDEAESPYLWADKLLAPITDLLMVMNQVDHQLAMKYRLAKKIRLIPGMGINLDKFTKADDEKKGLLKILAGFKPDDYLLIYAAEMSKRKNHGELIEAFALAMDEEPSMKLLLAGNGALKDKHMETVQQLGIEEHVCFLGYVTDMERWYAMSDCAITTSRCEGLPFNVMEAMASGLPVIASRIKGHTDLLGGQEHNLLYDLGDIEQLKSRILLFCRDEVLRTKAGVECSKEVFKYELGLAKAVILECYDSLHDDQPVGLLNSAEM
ncbi:glycosyltransferase, group 1 family protein [Desulfitobacterium hafniense DP7]|uniref:Glycosyltransferase, group 1 family protein n=1 Tax=Desulfitobacterium hafniense DP7 TaxID=537010 RepID=G9XVX4_DESHA|nr:glycosyltransferase [Desulfitobacterium hafniense]EHL04237.1 glycosyltransferase, group 1 family protein [Desulfitobacterium hafniense DP7]